MTLLLIIYTLLATLAAGFFWALCRAAGHDEPAYAPIRTSDAGALSHIRQLVLAPELGDRR